MKLPRLWASHKSWVAKSLLAQEDATALGLCRIALVFVFTLSMLAHLGSVAEYFSNETLLPGEYARQLFPNRFSLFYWIEDAWAVRLVFGVGIVAHIFWLIGLFTRPAAIISVIVWLSMTGRNPHLYAMPDQFHSCMAVYLALLPSGRGLSIDASIRGRGGPVPCWCRRILQLQLAIMYLSTGLLKTGETWKDGSAIYYALASPYNRHFAIAPFLATIHAYLLRPLTWSVRIWEVGFAVFVALHWLKQVTHWRRIPELRWIYLGFGVLMHLGIQCFLYIGWFTPLIIASYTAFLQPNEARWLIDRLLRRA